MPDNGSEWRKFRIVPRSHPLRPLVLYLVENFKGVEAEELLDYQGRAGIISIVRWNFRPVLCSVEKCWTLFKLRVVERCLELLRHI